MCAVVLPCSYVKPQNVETAEFLLEIATEDALGYLTDTSQSMTVDQLAAAFEGSAIHRDNMRVIDSPEVNQEVFVQVREATPWTAPGAKGQHPSAAPPLPAHAQGV